MFNAFWKICRRLWQEPTWFNTNKQTKYGPSRWPLFSITHHTKHTANKECRKVWHKVDSRDNIKDSIRQVTSQNVLSIMLVSSETTTNRSFFYELKSTSSWVNSQRNAAHNSYTHTHTHTRLTALFPGLPRWAGTRKGKSIWILLKHETVSGSGISWAHVTSAQHNEQ